MVVIKGHAYFKNLQLKAYGLLLLLGTKGLKQRIKTTAHIFLLVPKVNLMPKHIVPGDDPVFFGAKGVAKENTIKRYQV